MAANEWANFQWWFTNATDKLMPHTIAEKNAPYPLSPSGMPGVQTLLPVMLDHVNKGKLKIEQLIKLVCENPCDLFGIKNKG